MVSMRSSCSIGRSKRQECSNAISAVIAQCDMQYPTRENAQTEEGRCTVLKLFQLEIQDNYNEETKTNQLVSCQRKHYVAVADE